MTTGMTIDVSLTRKEDVAMRDIPHFPSRRQDEWSGGLQHG
jgi:hypothetical protein